MNEQERNEKRVCVVVLGDIGRSPRMQYHSLSLAEQGFAVDIISYGGSTPRQDVMDNANISIHFMSDPPKFIHNLPRIVGYGLKAIWQFFALLFAMFGLQVKPSHVLTQNPPSIPTLAVVWSYCILMSSKMIVDWHNYGFTIMSLTMGTKHPVVRFAKWVEVFFGRKAQCNLCVSNAMQQDLERNWGIRASVLYDRPPDTFHPLSIEEKHDLFKKLSADYSCFLSKDFPTGTAFTKETANGIEYRRVRPVLLVSSTSWTEDEDFSILLEALEAYEMSLQNAARSDLPKIVCVISGKGPMKDHYEEIISCKQFYHVQFCMPWLTAEDYPKLLASADLGVCLHTSSSGLDLPMKVVDMFGCRLPVLAYDFKCLHELVRHGENGMVFKEPTELKIQLQTLLAGFPEHSKELNRLSDNLDQFRAVPWHDNWKTNALNLFRD